MELSVGIISNRIEIDLKDWKNHSFLPRMKKSFVEVSYSIWICRLLQHNWLLCIRTPDSFLKWVRCLAQDIQITGAVSFQITWLCCNLPPQHSDNCPYNWGGREGKEKKKKKTHKPNRNTETLLKNRFFLILQ